MAGPNVVVDFEPRSDVLAEARASGDIEMPAGWLEIESLAMPLTFRVHGVDLIPQTEEWWQPLLYAARTLTWFIRNLRDGESDGMQFAMGGGVWMKRVGGRVTLSPLQRVSDVKTVDVDYSELLAAWEECSARIRDYLLKNLPELAANPDLAPWFRGEED